MILEIVIIVTEWTKIVVWAECIVKVVKHCFDLTGIVRRLMDCYHLFCRLDADSTRCHPSILINTHPLSCRHAEPCHIICTLDSA